MHVFMYANYVRKYGDHFSMAVAAGLLAAFPLTNIGG